MVSERNRILELVNYIESLGITVNCAKNKARGNKGFFKVKAEKFRIDIAQGLSDEEILRVLVHEFSHYIHYKNDKTLKSLNFILPTIDNLLLEELITLTVDAIPKETIEPLFKMHERLEKEVNSIKKDKNSFVMYLELQSKERLLKSVKTKMQRVNRYYNSKTELFARSMEQFILNVENFRLRAPNLYNLYSEFVETKKDLELNNFLEILLK